MKDKAFLDSNILLYAFSMDDPEKQERSGRIIESEPCCTSVQALNEFCNVCLKKWRFNRQTIETAIDYLLGWCSVDQVSTKTLRRALAMQEKYGYSYYDCVMLASALDYDCNIIYSEDMSDGQVIEGRLKITNPFKQ